MLQKEEGKNKLILWARPFSVTGWHRVPYWPLRTTVSVPILRTGSNFDWNKKRIIIEILALVGDELTLLIYFFYLQTIERGLKTTPNLPQDVPVHVLCQDWRLNSVSYLPFSFFLFTLNITWVSVYKPEQRSKIRCQISKTHLSVDHFSRKLFWCVLVKS